jgi:hypothetical protein
LDLRESKLIKEQRNMRNRVFIIYNLQQTLLHYQIKEVERAGNTARTTEVRNAFKMLVGKPEMVDHLEDLGIILKSILKKSREGVG